MIVYKDMTFCNWWRGCRKGKTCVRALTPKTLLNARKSGLPICHYILPPECFNTKKAK